jgi:hypothetical protein
VRARTSIHKGRSGHSCRARHPQRTGSGPFVRTYIFMGLLTPVKNSWAFLLRPTLCWQWEALKGEGRSELILHGVFGAHKGRIIWATVRIRPSAWVPLFHSQTFLVLREVVLRSTFPYFAFFRSNCLLSILYPSSGALCDCVEWWRR